jgi:multicomponent Na+:H+ antiporter subunit E
MDQGHGRRGAAIAVWAMATWVLLTWTTAAQPLAFGLAASILTAVALVGLGPVIAPWRLLEPRRLALIARLAAVMAVSVVRANLGLARRIWSPSLPLRSGMLIVPTRAATPAGLAAVGLLSSLVVDNQLVDVDAEAHELLFHAIWVRTTDPEAGREQITAPVERLVERLEARP